MSNHIRRAAAAALSLVCLLPALIHAQESEDVRIDSPYRWIENRLRLGLSLGYHAASRGNLDFGQGPSPFAGGRFRLRVSSPLSLELGASYAPAERWVVDPRPETGPAVVDTVSAGWLKADVGIQFGLTGARTWNGIHPYVMLGGGWIFGVDEGASPELAEEEDVPFRYDISTAPHAYLGLGFEIFASDHLGIGFELRDQIVRVQVPVGYFQTTVLENLEAAGADLPEETQWLHNPEPAIVFWWYP